MSTTSSPSRSAQEVTVAPLDSPDLKEKKPIPVESKLENRLTIKDLERLRTNFMVEGDGYDNKLSLTKDQFCEALTLLLKKGTREEYSELFDKIDVTREGSVDWDRLASHMLLEFYEKDDRVKSTQVPQWKDIKALPSPHKEIIQRVSFLKNTNRYIAISKEGIVSMWGTDLKAQRHLKTGTDSCKTRDLWVTHFVPLQNINKIALAFTSKEISIYDLSSKLEFNCQYRVQGLTFTPLCLDYWSNPNNANDAILVWGDVGGFINILFFNSANIALFERPPAPAGEKQEPCLNVQLKDVVSGLYKNAFFFKYEAHNERNKGEWVREVKYSQYLECFISCATTTSNALVIGWMEKHSSVSQNIKGGAPPKKGIQRKFEFNVSQGINSFAYNQHLNLIATAGVNNHVCLWNPYVISKPNGVLRGHMASVVQVHFITSRSQLISFSKDKVLRIWDVQLQVCIQRLAGMFPKGPEVMCTLFFDEGRGRSGQERNRLFISFNYQLTVMAMKNEIKDRVMSHEKPVVAAVYNSVYNQVVSVCQAGTITMWMLDTGQKVKQFNNTHGNSEVTCLTQDNSETHIYTGSTDGTVKVWDFNGHCYHSLECAGGQPADIGQILVLKRMVLVVGWARCITVFRNSAFREFHVVPNEWKGGQEHLEDILSCSFTAPNTLATGSYDGEVVLWNTNSEHASRKCSQRSRKALKSRGKSRGDRASKQTNGSGYNTRQNSQLKLPDLPNEGTGVSTSIFGRISRSAKSGSGRQQDADKNRKSNSQGSSDEQNEFGWAVARLIFLETRKGNSASGGANLISCGGNGFVRFWNSARNSLVSEFVAHQNAGSVIMAVDHNNDYLSTADMDGLVKVWDIQQYALIAADQIIIDPPPLQCMYQPHQDQINSLAMCERNERTLIISASSDCSVALWDVYGNRIGIFGQEEHWRIEEYNPADEVEEEEEVVEVEAEVDVVNVVTDEESDWEPEEEAVTEPSHYRVNAWDQTVLGKDYQELRVQKRERRQPGLIGDLPYAGPYSALNTKELIDTHMLTKPDAEKYFSERPGSSDFSGSRFPTLAETLITPFDEKSLFPAYILDYERKMKNYHAMALNQGGAKGKNLRSTLQNIGMQINNAQNQGRSMSPRKSIAPKPGIKLRPLPGTRKNSLATTSGTATLVE